MADTPKTKEPIHAKDAGDMPDAPPPLNREQRRAQKFHRHAGARQDNLQTQRQNNTGFLSTPSEPLAEDANPALEAGSTPGAEEHGGPGTGGETKTAGRVAQHEGTHRGNPTRS